LLLRMKSLYVLLFSSLAFVVYARDQTVGVRGTLMCGSEPLSDAEVKLWELDTWPDPDDELATVRTDKQGRFEIHGTENEFTSISPVLKFYHRCNNKGLFNIPKLCKRKLTYEVPSSYINSGKNVGKWYEMGTVNMEAKQKGEGTECL
ncbi:hypothetical protein PFISCL1PPCAC_24228, partial [Pristionchus fissidentatus]